MNISDVKINMQDSLDEIKAMATVFFQEGYEISNVQIIEGKTGIYVVMPPKLKISQNGFIKEKRFKTEERLLIQKEVLKFYNRALQGDTEEEIYFDEELKDEELKDEELTNMEVEQKVELANGALKENNIEALDHIENMDKVNKELQSDLQKTVNLTSLQDQLSILELNEEREQRIDKILNQNSIKYYGDNYIEEIDPQIDLKVLLADKERLFPGNELFINDLNLNPRINISIANKLAEKYSGTELDYVITIENRGVLLAYEVAKILGTNLVIIKCRDNLKEGASFTTEYEEDGKKILLGISKMLFKENSNCILIDNNINNSNLIKATIDLVNQNNSVLKGIGLIFEDVRYQMDTYDTEIVSLVKYSGIDDNFIPIIY